MGALKDKDKEKVRAIFKHIDHKVVVIMFTQEYECMHCEMTRTMLEEVTGLSNQIYLEAHDFVADKDLAAEYGVDKIPATIVMGEKDYGIRFFGVPGGYEFTVLIQEISSVGRRDPEVSSEAMIELAKIDTPVHLQVITSLTCPYCPGAVRSAHKLAMASDQITADMIDGLEFPFLVNKYNVQGVPHTVINEEHSVIGSQKDVDLAKEILKAIGK